MKTVIVIMCKQPIPGRVKTRLAKHVGDEAAARLYGAFLKDIIERMRDVADRRILCYAPDNDHARAYFDGHGGGYELLPQVAGDLGNRLDGVFRHALGSGRRNVIVIGSDCPTISQDRLLTASELLDSADDDCDSKPAVLGQCVDGGYHLIGLQQMGKHIFDRIDWSTSSVYHQQSQRLVDEGYAVHSLPPIPEVDTIDDLEQLQNHVDTGSNTYRVLNELSVR